MTASARILALVQAHPEIGTDYDSTDLANLIEEAKNFLKIECRLPIFPDDLQGYSKSAASAATDISAISTALLLISVNGSNWYELTLTLSGLTSGALIAAHLQSIIRAADETDFGFDEVTVAYDSSDGTYTATSGRYGEDSKVNFSFEEDYKHVAKNLKLSPTYGGVEETGSARDDEMEHLCARFVEAMVARRGLEGVEEFQKKDIRGVFEAMDPVVKDWIRNKRRMWT